VSFTACKLRELTSWATVLPSSTALCGENPTLRQDLVDSLSCGRLGPATLSPFSSKCTTSFNVAQSGEFVRLCVHVLVPEATDMAASGPLPDATEPARLLKVMPERSPEVAPESTHRSRSTASAGAPCARDCCFPRCSLCAAGSKPPVTSNSPSGLSQSSQPSVPVKDYRLQEQACLRGLQTTESGGIFRDAWRRMSGGEKA
jgi:hypothetical protein